MKKRPLKRSDALVDKGQNTIYNTLYKNLIYALRLRNEDISRLVAEARLPYTNSMVTGWRYNEDNTKKFRVMRLEELVMMSEVMKRHARGEPIEDLSGRITVKGYHKKDEAENDA